MTDRIYTAREILENLRRQLAASPTLAAQATSLEDLSQAEQAEFLFLMIHSFSDTFLKELRRIRLDMPAPGFFTSTREPPKTN